MKQLTLSLKNGKIEVIEIPIPNIDDNSVLIKNKYSLISSGTEGSLIEFGKSNFFKKVINQKDKVQIVFDKLKRDGLISTIKSVNNKLNNNIQLGYCSVGEVIQSNSTNFKIGQRVISNGSHAEFVTVPENLCHLVPEDVDDVDAVYTVIASIALQGVRSLSPRIGDKIIVYGLGLIGQISMQILNANGCNAIGLDIDQSKVDLTKNLGYLAYKNDNELNTKKLINNFSSELGVDSVLICAHSNDDSIINLSANYCRPEGNIVLIGSTNISINRDAFYKKQISFKVSSSYGPGRYDNNYEFGQDYPIGYVRWTANRNFGEILRLISSKKLYFKKFNSHLYKITDFEEAYDSLKKNNQVSIFKYDFDKKKDIDQLKLDTFSRKEEKELKYDVNLNTCFLGAGNFSSRYLIPYFQKEGFILDTIISNKGISANKIAKKFNFNYVSSNFDEVLSNKRINNLVISTPHNLHSEQLIKALSYKIKNIYIDKPLAINFEQLNKIKNKIKSIDYSPNIIVGYNRKFSPLIVPLKERLDFLKSPKFINININAGYIDKNHWINNKLVGGGRLIGECCHFIDLSIHLINSDVYKSKISNLNTSKIVKEESFIIQLFFKDGSIVNINYLSNGSKSYMKEKIEIYCDGANYIIEDFKKLRIFGDNSMKNMNLFFQDKGIKNLIRNFKKMVCNSETIQFHNQLKVSELILELSNNINLDE